MQSKRHQDLWDLGIAAVAAFAAREGHSTVPQLHREDEVALGRWVSDRRRSYRKGQLSREQIEQLESFPLWQWDVVIMPPVADHQRRWVEGIAALEVFAAREGHSSVPRRHREGDVGLGYWVDNKRKNYRNGTLSAEQIAQLEAFPSWDWGPYDNRWWPDYEIFKAHVLTGGSPDPERGTMADGVELSAWCAQQQMRHRIGTLSADASRALEEVPGWEWKTSVPLHERRNTTLSAYRNFRSREGHGRVPTTHVENGCTLGRYLMNARQLLKNGQGSDSTRRLLDAVSTDWRKSLLDEPVFSAKQQKAHARYQRFVFREGHGRVPTKHVEWGFDLGSYLAQKRHSLSQPHPVGRHIQELLDSVSTDWRRPIEARNQFTTYPKAA